MDKIPYKKTEPMAVVLLFLVSRERHLGAAVEHVAWLNLQSPDLRQKYFLGTYEPVTETTHGHELKRYGCLRRQLWRSFTQVATIVILSLVVGLSLGMIDWS